MYVDVAWFSRESENLRREQLFEPAAAPKPCEKQALDGVLPENAVNGIRTFEPGFLNCESGALQCCGQLAACLFVGMVGAARSGAHFLPKSPR